MNTLQINAQEVKNTIERFLNNNEVETDKITKLINYYLLLETYRKKINLVGKCGWLDFLKYHILDSISILKFDLISGGERLCDIGSGGGLPAIPIKIFMPQINLVMVESVRKKTNALKDIVYKIGLNEIEILNDRTENLGAQEKWRGEFDITTIRALGKSEIVLEYAMPLLKIGGKCVLYKTETEEINLRALKILGGNIDRIYDYKIDGLLKARRLIVIVKNEETSRKFPRKVGIAKRHPLSI